MAVDKVVAIGLAAGLALAQMGIDNEALPGRPELHQATDIVGPPPPENHKSPHFQQRVGGGYALHPPQQPGACRASQNERQCGQASSLARRSDLSMTALRRGAADSDSRINLVRIAPTRTRTTISRTIMALDRVHVSGFNDCQ